MQGRSNRIVNPRLELSKNEKSHLGPSQRFRPSNRYTNKEILQTRQQVGYKDNNTLLIQFQRANLREALPIKMEFHPIEPFSLTKRQLETFIQAKLCQQQ